MRRQIWLIRKWWFWHVNHWLLWHIAQLGRRVHGRGPLLVAMGDSLTSPFTGWTLPWQIWLRRLGRLGYKTVNLGVGGETTADMCRRVEEFLSEGQPEIAVLFTGSVDAERGIDPNETARNVAFIVAWLREHGVRKIALIGPGMLNLPRIPEYMSQISDWFSAIDPVRQRLREVAARHEVAFVDLAEFLRERVARGEDPDFSRVRYRQSRSWHVCDWDAHLNAYGQQLVAEAVLTATTDWWPARARIRSLPLTGRAVA